MKALFKSLAILVFAISLGIVIYGAYLGFVPGLSKLMGSTKPKEFGITYTQKDFDSYIKKAKSQIIASKSMSADKSMVFSGKIGVDESFSQEEISARLNYSKWKYMPIRNAQLRINADGSVDFSANLVTNRLEGFLKEIVGNSVTNSDAEQMLRVLNKLAPNPSVYIHFNAQAKENIATVDVQEFKVGRFDVPLEKVGGNAAVATLVNHVFDKVPGFYVDSVTFANGKMTFKGQVPEKTTVLTE